MNENHATQNTSYQDNLAIESFVRSACILVSSGRKYYHPTEPKVLVLFLQQKYNLHICCIS